MLAPLLVFGLGWIVALVPAWFAPPKTAGGEPTFQLLATLLAVFVLAPAVAVLGTATALLGVRFPRGRRRLLVRVLGGTAWVVAVGPALVLGAWFTQVDRGVPGLVVYSAVWVFLLFRGLRFAAGGVGQG